MNKTERSESGQDLYVNQGGGFIVYFLQLKSPV